MLQTEFRGPAGPKRARTDGASRGEGDWTCPQCGNVNFAFRTTCNMRKCGATKPAEAAPVHSLAGLQRGLVPLGPVYEQAPAPMYISGPGAPPPLPMALPASYGAPVPIAPPPPAVQYDYGAAVNNPASYNPIPMASTYPPPGSVIGGVFYAVQGPGYGTAPIVDGYAMGLGMGRGPPMPGPRGPNIYPEENGSRKRRGDHSAPDGFSEGDWVCPKCGNTNFAFRTTCNMRKCGAPKPTESSSRHGNGPATRPPTSQGPPPDGSWTCDACGNVNYPFRTKCNRRNCGAEKPTDSKPPAVFPPP